MSVAPARYRRPYRHLARNASLPRKLRSPGWADRLAAITALDAGVGRVVEALRTAGLYDNAVVIFSTDNGGGTALANRPLRGKKDSLYEGGVRGVGWVHSRLLEKTGRSAPDL